MPPSRSCTPPQHSGQPPRCCTPPPRHSEVARTPLPCRSAAVRRPYAPPNAVAAPTQLHATSTPLAAPSPLYAASMPSRRLPQDDLTPLPLRCTPHLRHLHAVACSTPSCTAPQAGFAAGFARLRSSIWRYGEDSTGSGETIWGYYGMEENIWGYGKLGRS